MNSFSVVFSFNYPTRKERFLTQWRLCCLQAIMYLVCILRLVFPVEDDWNQNCKSHWNHVEQVTKWIYTLHSQLILLVEEFEVSIGFNSLHAGIHKLIPWMPRYTSPHFCEKLHHLDIGSSTAAVACHWQDTFSAWLLVLPNASIRSVRHVSTIVALSVAEVPGWYRGVSGPRGQGLVLQRRSPKLTGRSSCKASNHWGWLLLF